MKFREKRIRWSEPNYVGRKNGIEIIVDLSRYGWYFYGGGHNSLNSEVGAFKTKEEAFDVAERWCIQQKKIKEEEKK